MPFQTMHQHSLPEGYKTEHIWRLAETKKAGRAIWEADAMPMPPLETGRIA